MIIFRSLRVKGVAPYKDTTFQFKTGISVIYGLNKTTSASNNGNAAGKSRFFSQLPETIFDSPVLGTTQDRVQSGERWLDADINGNSYTFYRKGGKLQVLTRDGASVGRTTKETKQWIAKNLPLTEEDSESYLYLDSLRHHPLVRGTSTERKNFLDSFFDLERIGLEKKRIMAALADLKPLKATHEELFKERNALQERIASSEGPSLRDLKLNIKELSEQLDVVQTKNTRSLELRRVQEYVKDHEKPIQELLRALQDTPISEESFAEALENARTSLRENQQDLKLARAYADYKRDRANYDSALAKLSKRARIYATDPDRLRKAKKVYSAYEEAVAEYKHNCRILPESYPRPDEVQKPKGDKREQIAMRDLIISKIDHAHTFGSGTCPTCGQEVEVADIEALKSKLEKLKKSISKHNAYEDYELHYKEWHANEELIRTCERNIELQKSLIDKWKPVYDAVNELRNLPDEPEEYTGPKKELAVYERMVQEDRYRVQCLELLEPGLHLLLQEPKVRGKKIRDYSAQMRELTEQYAEATAKLGVLRTQRKRLKDIEARMLEMEDELKHERLLKLMLQAYADKGMRKMAVTAISHSLMAQVNKYASRIFPENYRFELSWEKSQISILCHRRYGKKVEVSDVRKLSGAESRLFTYVMVLSLLTFVPENKRCSVLILDEPATNMSAETRESFKELLHVMNSIIPCIIVITPKSDEVYDGAISYTAVKKNGVSTLVEGHPSTIRG